MVLGQTQDKKSIFGGKESQKLLKASAEEIWNEIEDKYRKCIKELRSRYDLKSLRVYLH